MDFKIRLILLYNQRSASSTRSHGELKFWENRGSNCGHLLPRLGATSGSEAVPTNGEHGRCRRACSTSPPECYAPALYMRGNTSTTSTNGPTINMGLR